MMKNMDIIRTKMKKLLNQKRDLLMKKGKLNTKKKLKKKKKKKEITY